MAMRMPHTAVRRDTIRAESRTRNGRVQEGSGEDEPAPGSASCFSSKSPAVVFQARRAALARSAALGVAAVETGGTALLKDERRLAATRALRGRRGLADGFGAQAEAHRRFGL